MKKFFAIGMMALALGACKETPEENEGEPNKPGPDTEKYFTFSNEGTVVTVVGSGDLPTDWLWDVVYADEVAMVDEAFVEEYVQSSYEMFLELFGVTEQEFSLAEYVAEITCRAGETNSYDYAEVGIEAGNYVAWACGVDENGKAATAVEFYSFTLTEDDIPEEEIVLVNTLTEDVVFTAVDGCIGYFGDYYGIGCDNYWLELCAIGSDENGYFTDGEYVSFDIFTPVMADPSPVGTYTFNMEDDYWMQTGYTMVGYEGYMMGSYYATLLEEDIDTTQPYGGFTGGTLTVSTNDDGTFSAKVDAMIGEYSVKCEFNSLWGYSDVQDYSAQLAARKAEQKRSRTAPAKVVAQPTIKGFMLR